LDVREPLPSGYHRLEVTTPSGTATSLLLTVPARPRAPAARSAPRAWGLFAPLYALHDRQTWGCGDFSALERFVAWAADHGATVVGTLPILSAFLDRLYDPSPYRPVSRTFWNEVFLDVTREPEYEGSELVQRIVASADFQNELERLRSREYVDLRRVARLKRQVLEGMLAQLRSGPSRRSAELDRFSRKEDRLAAYARFRAEMEVHRRPPRSREEAPSDPSGPPDHEAIARADYHRYVQWLSTRQLEAVSRFGRRRNVDLYLDVPLGTHPEGFDAWWEGPAIVSGASIGVPPDPGFPAGQNWGIAPANPERLREEGYAAFVATVRKHLDIVRVLRIDHVMGIHRLFWILNGTRARDGAFVRNRSEELYAVLEIEAARGHAALVGEDLGTVPPEVRPAMARHGLLRSYVQQLEWDDPTLRSPRRCPENALASLNTHDMIPFAAYWLGRRETDRRIHGHPPRLPRAVAEAPDVEEALRRAIEPLARGPARFLLLNVEDLWGETRPQNIPGTVGLGKNFGRRTRLSLEEIYAHPGIAKTLRTVEGWRAS
jgi:4-alpha-glucanotransferase